VASAGPYANHLHLGPDRSTTPVPHHSVFTRRMLFLPPNHATASKHWRQCEGTYIYTT